MPEHLQFTSREDFRNWLQDNCESSNGVWLLFGKRGGPKTVKASEALEEALCFGWIDGQMQSIDDKAYLKYFSRRRKNSKWSAKNKALVESLEKQGLMTEHGREKIQEAKNNGNWDKATSMSITEADIEKLMEQIKNHEPAFSNFMAMSHSVKKAYTWLYLDAKSESTRARRLEKIIDQLSKNLKPM